MIATQPSPTFDYRILLKVVGFICAGAFSAFALFVLMGKLVYSDQLSYGDPKESITVELLSVPDEQATKVIKPQLPPPPAVPNPPPRQPPVVNNTNNTPGIGAPDIDVSVSPAGLDDFSLSAPTNNEAIAIVQVEPKYPSDAARDGIEGWVTLSFTVDELGQVTDVAIIDAKPKRVFNREAQRAIKKWKYRPKVVDGKPVRQPNQSVLLEFKLGQ